MTQSEALDILKTGANVFLTGEPGAGKTYTINKFVDYLREQKMDYAMTASTGIAATHIGGMTIHSWSGIGIKNKLTPYDLDKISSSEYLSRRIRKARTLIIDEVSMLGADMLDMVDAVCREVKNSSAPFGGMQVVLVGDFFQLPPIKKVDAKEMSQELFMQNKARFAFESRSWAKLTPLVCYLSEQHRQDDAPFLELLISIRRNKFSKLHHGKLKSRHVKNENLPSNITKLFSHNLDVDKINEMEIAKLDSEEKNFQMTSEGQNTLVEILKKGCLSPANLVLKKGAVVMCTKNNPKDGFVNGTIGTVVDFEVFSNYPIIKTKNGRNISIAPMDWTIEENGKIKAKISQVPLRLAWAITVHKSQGMSLDSAIVDLSDVFEYGQGYVALSRVRRLDGLYLLGLNEMAVRVHPEILEIDEVFRQDSKNTEEVFAKISKNELQKMHKNFIVASGGEWKEERMKDSKKKIKKSHVYQSQSKSRAE